VGTDEYVPREQSFTSDTDQPEEKAVAIQGKIEMLFWESMSALCVLVQTSLCVSSVLTHRRIHFGCVW
jgi:hypothetical protein